MHVDYPDHERSSDAFLSAEQLAFNLPSIAVSAEPVSLAPLVAHAPQKMVCNSGRWGNPGQSVVEPGHLGRGKALRCQQCRISEVPDGNL